MTVACIGLGNLGAAIAERLVQQGHEVHVHDVAAGPVAAAVGAGARAAATPAAAAAGAAVACVVVRTDDQAVEAVTGANGVLAGGSEGVVVCLHSTVAPSTVEELAAACRAAGAWLLDAGVSGGPDRALAGDLVTVVGGDRAALDRARTILDAYCSDVIHCGPSGAGMAAKLARNLAQYGIWCALYESMELAAAAGVDLGLYARYVRASGLPGNHDVILGREAVTPVDAAADPAEGERLAWAVALGHKDLADAFELAERLGRDVPIGRIADDRYALAMGLAEDPASRR